MAAESPHIVVYDSTGHERFRTEIEEFTDVAGVGEEIWAVSPGQLTRISVKDGSQLGSAKLDYLDPAGRLLISATAPHLAVWHGAEPVLLTATGKTEIPGPGGEAILPLADGRWLLWGAGQLQLWRSLGQAWRKGLGERGMRVIDAQLVLDGRLFVLAQQKSTSADGASDLRLSVAAVNDGAPTTQLKLPKVSGIAIAARRGLALLRSGDRLAVFDLRFGRWIRDLALPAGVTEVAVDDACQRIALGSPSGLELVRPDALAAPSREELDASEAEEAEARARASTTGAGERGGDLTEDGEGAVEGPVAELADLIEILPDAPGAAPAAPADGTEPFSDAPLARLEPVSVIPTATAGEIAQAIDMRLHLVGARAHASIADGWDVGRITKPDLVRPPFADEVAGLLRLTSGRAPADLAAASARLQAVEDANRVSERNRGGRLTPLDVLARDFRLSPLAVALLFAVAAPRMRGELARLFGILANDPGRAVVDELLLGQLYATQSGLAIARELDGDMPLRKYGLVRSGPGDRPFAPLTVDPLVIRYITNQPADGEPDLHLTVRHVDRDLEELQMPRALIAKALRFLASPRDTGPVRIAVRGRTGSGRHTLLTSLAARAGRSLGLVDLSRMPRDTGRLGPLLEAALRRAMLRGLVPCVDGLELVSSEDPETKIGLATALRDHPGPVAVRLPAEALIPLDPGYLALDIPMRDERQRTASWLAALERQQIDLADTTDLAARYRVGPGIIERVTSEVARRPDHPTTPVGWAQELDDAVRQHLENRLGATANRVTRLANWSDIVLPEDIIDSLLEMTARVRHRKKVYEQWGFDKSITTARGITALFQGTPGTGKTMVAGVIARDLGLELYRVDVSRITSKWIGETEKNLGSLFDAAEDGQVMLLFDEADSLFAKRTEVKTSVDRYSNMEVNYLLQRLDTFEGIAILTTNFGNAIDPAFKRRLTYRMTFPFPDEEMREQLWKSMLPPQVPIAGTLDFSNLSQRFRLSGGYIRNAVLRAAFLAAEEGTSLMQEHLERAIRMEFREIGKLAESGTLE